MANVDWAFGLRPLRFLSGAPYNGAANTYFVPSTDATAIYIGGLVKKVANADADGVPIVTGNVAAQDVVMGVVVGFLPTTADSPVHRPASTGRYVIVADDPRIVFTCQENASGGALAVTDAGKFAALAGFTSGNAVTGYSGIEIASNTANATKGNLDVQLIGVTQTVNNVVGAKAEWLVRLVRHEFA